MILGQQTCFESQKQGTNSGRCLLQADQSDMFHLSSRKFPNELARVGYLAQKTWMVIVLLLIRMNWSILTRFQVDMILTNWKQQLQVVFLKPTEVQSTGQRPHGWWHSAGWLGHQSWHVVTRVVTKEKERMSMVIKVLCMLWALERLRKVMEIFLGEDPLMVVNHNWTFCIAAGISDYRWWNIQFTNQYHRSVGLLF